MINDQANTPPPHEEQGRSDADGSATQLSNIRLMEIFEGTDDGKSPTGIIRVFNALTNEDNSLFIARLHRDITAIFHGRYRGYHSNYGHYHNLRHTFAVSLATVRLLHGLACQSVTMPAELLKLTLVCAYFHDTGMLLTDKDTEPVGAAHVKNHEQRSIANVRQYMVERNQLPSLIDQAATIINCTNLTLDPNSQRFASKAIQLAGHVLGTADILAQMADRYYLEALPHLYIEQQAAGIHRYPSAIDLMRQTTAFYHQVIEKRLHRVLNDTCMAMRTHFRVWWHLDRNLYTDFIEQNIHYLEHVITLYDSGNVNLDDYLRRQQPPV